MGLLNDETSLELDSEYTLINRLIEMECQVPIASEQECLRFYQQNQSKFTTSPLLEVRHILLAVAPDDVNDRIRVKDLAQEMIATIAQSPVMFEELVDRHSACPSKEMKGNLGQISQGQTVPEFERHLFNAKVGLLPYPIESRYGFHVAIIDRKVDGRQLPFEYVKDKVTEYLNEKVKRKKYQPVHSAADSRS